MKCHSNASHMSTLSFRRDVLLSRRKAVLWPVATGKQVSGLGYSTVRLDALCSSQAAKHVRQGQAEHMHRLLRKSDRVMSTAHSHPLPTALE